MKEQIPEFIETVLFEKRAKYCLLIPLFNEGKRYIAQIEKMKKAGVFKKVDVIICDAGSTDGSTELDILKKSGHRAILVRQGKGRYSTDLRMGYYWAIQQGYAGFITVDGNDKDDVTAIDLFIQKLDEGYDYVQGSRFIRGGKKVNTPFIRLAAMRLINEPVMSLCAHRHLTDTTNGFRAYSRSFFLDELLKPSYIDGKQTG